MNCSNLKHIYCLKIENIREQNRILYCYQLKFGGYGIKIKFIFGVKKEMIGSTYSIHYILLEKRIFTINSTRKI